MGDHPDRDEPPADPPLTPGPESEPQHPGLLALWIERGHRLRAQAEGARSSHASVDVGFSLFENDSAIGGGLLAGALAYRLFVLLLPSALLARVRSRAPTRTLPTRARARLPGTQACTDSSRHR